MAGGFDSGFQQAYGATFARVYNERWTTFAERVGQQIADFFSQDPKTTTATRSLLDLCCGTGQLSREFLARGYQVVGIDLSPHMLKYSTQNNRQAVTEGRATFSLGDASNFRLGRPVSFAVSSFDALNHLPDNERLGSCFKCVFNSLQSPGLFVFDLNTPVGFRRRWNGMELHDNEELTLVNRSIYAEGSKHAFTSITGFVRSPDGSYERFTQKVFETAFDITEVLGLLSEAGFTDSYVAASHDLSAVAQRFDELDRAFFVCRRE